MALEDHWTFCVCGDGVSDHVAGHGECERCDCPFFELDEARALADGPRAATGEPGLAAAA